MSVEAIKSQIVKLKMNELETNPLSCLVDSGIDINPHQIGAFVEAIDALYIGGLILADEVGLGKTIEAGLVLKYCIQKGYKNILLIMPSSLRKQWQIELMDKFDIHSVIVDSSNMHEYRNDKDNGYNVLICSYAFASNKSSYLSSISWELVVFDEAHKLRNVHKSNVKMAKRLKTLTEGIPKLMLTATPLQNNIYDLYGLISFIDDRIFLDKKTFTSKYLKEQNFEALKKQIQPVLYRTLRKDVLEYISYKNRTCITIDFKLSPQEAILYTLVTDYLKRDIIYAIPSSNRNLVTMIIRKLLASSSYAVYETFVVMKERLIKLKESTMEQTIESSLDDFMDFIDDEIEEEENQSPVVELYDRDMVNQFIQHEIDLVDNILKQAQNITKNSKSTALIEAIKIAFEKQDELNIDNKIVVFTESVRTQDYLYKELLKSGFAEDDILLFNGSLNDDHTKEVYKAWRALNFNNRSNNRNVEIKHAVVDYFKRFSKILLVTDAGSEGLNLQFCNTVINYDLPWNPQKIEQRIGRCHRYGQVNDVVVINLLNTENAADSRVYEILSDKLKLFDGIFGTSDEALGLLESGSGFEKRVMEIYQSCQTVGQFNKEFNKLEKEFEKKRNKKFNEMKILLEKEAKTHEQNETVKGNVIGYLNDHDYWSKQIFDNKYDNTPRSYRAKIKPMDLLKVKSGYIIIGGFYDNSKFIEPIILAMDRELNIVDFGHREVFKLISENLLDIEDGGKQRDFKKVIDELYKVIIVNNEMRYKELNSVIKDRLDNWVELRREQIRLDLEAVELTISDLLEKQKSSKVFKEKVAIKKEVEQLQDGLLKQQEEFHNIIESIVDEADTARQNFSNSFDINPIVFINTIIEFETEVTDD